MQDEKSNVCTLFLVLERSGCVVEYFWGVGISRACMGSTTIITADLIRGVCGNRQAVLSMSHSLTLSYIALVRESS